MGSNGGMNISRRALIFALSCAPLFGQGLGKGMIVILLGPPGAGKTTQAEYLKKRYGLKVLSAADVVRSTSKKSFKGGLAGQVQAGDLLSDDSLNSIMRDAIRKSDHVKGFVLDGYPSNKAQADYLASIAKDQDLQSPVTVVIEIPDDVSRQRLTARKDPADTPENIDRRIADFHREWEAIKAAYPSVKILMVDGNKSRSEVSSAISAALESVH